MPSEPAYKPIKFINYSDPKPSRYINVTSRDKDGWGRLLSPFHLRCATLFFGEPQSVGNVELVLPYNVENAWQFSKVYKWDWDEQNQTPKDSYWKWAKEGWADKRAQRYPVGKGVKPVCSWWRGRRHDYIQARFSIYIYVYAYSLLAQKETWSQMLEWYQNEDEPTILDFDVYDKTGISYGDVFRDPTRKAGHGFVIGAMLEFGDQFFDWLHHNTGIYGWSI